MSHDPAKRRRNLRKHGIDLPGCMAAFDAPMVTFEDDRDDYGEQRFVSPVSRTDAWSCWCGPNAKTDRRLISCREANFMNAKRTSARTPPH
ncbi:MAG: BrnT family toxin [Lysobacterales bacterium]